MNQHQTHLCYESDGLRIENHLCSGADTPRSEEETSENHEIVFPRSGMYVRRDSSGEFAVDPHHILFFHKHQPFQIKHPFPCCDRSTVITIAPHILRDMLDLIDESANDRPYAPFMNTFVQTDTRLRLFQYQFWQTIYNHQDHLSTDEQLLMILAEIMCSAVSLDVVPSHYQNVRTYKAHAEIVEAVKIFLNRHYRESLTLDSIAGQVHHSPFALSRLFRTHTGLPIHQYLKRLRLLNSLELLLEQPMMPIGQIGVDLGFVTPSHFSTAFLDTFGITPSEFRASPTRYPPLEISKNLKV